jgi:Spy/CpxP family protein refolding chaperone
MTHREKEQNMKSPMRIAAAAATAALVVGAGGAASADRGGNDGPGGNHAGGHGSHGFEHHQQQLTREIDRVGDRMDRATRESRLAPLADDVRAGVLGNVEADKAALADLAALVDAATTRSDLNDLRKQLRDVRPENYDVTVANLRSADRLSDRIADLRTAAAGDPTALAAFDEADALVASATDKALAITASSSKADVRAVKADLVAAKHLVDDGADDAVVTP